MGGLPEERISDCYTAGARTCRTHFKSVWLKTRLTRMMTTSLNGVIVIVTARNRTHDLQIIGTPSFWHGEDFQWELTAQND